MLPAHVTIDGDDYLIGALPEDSEDDGNYHGADQCIRLKPFMGQGYTRTVLLHELIHACYEHAGSPSEPLAEEQVALLVSRRLLPILRDNPELVQYLTAK